MLALQCIKISYLILILNIMHIRDIDNIKAAEPATQISKLATLAQIM